MSTNDGEAPWYAAYPAAKSIPAVVSRSEVRQWLESSMAGDKGAFVLIDLRRNDHEGGTIHGSINLPAQSLYPSIPTLFDLFAAAKIKKVVWYCGQYSKRVVSTAVLCSIAQLCVIGSSRGRGNRAAGWFADYLKQRGEKGDGMESLVLEGGVKGWASAGEEYVRLMDDNDAAVWAG